MAIYFILFESNLISIVENRLMYLYKSNSRYFNNILFFYIRAVVIVWECNYLCNQCLIVSLYPTNGDVYNLW